MQHGTSVSATALIITEFNMTIFRLKFWKILFLSNYFIGKKKRKRRKKTKIFLKILSKIYMLLFDQ